LSNGVVDLLTGLTTSPGKTMSVLTTFTTAGTVTFELEDYTSVTRNGEALMTSGTRVPFGSPAKDITGFTVPGQAGPSTITTTDPATVSVEVLYGTDVTNLAPTIVVSPGATISPASDEAQDFTDPVEYLVEAADGTTKTYTVTVTVGAPPPSYSIALDPVAHTFPAAVHGYDPQAPRTVTVTNTGNQPTGALSVNLAGANPTAFTASTSTVANIPVGETATFTVTPANGLEAGSYSAIVTVSGDHGIAQSLTVAFTVDVDFTDLDAALAQAALTTRTTETDATWQALQVAVAAGTAVRAQVGVSQAQVDQAAQAIWDALAQLRHEYPVTDHFGSWTQGTSAGTGAVVAAPHTEFVRLLYGGEVVDPADYTIEQTGSAGTGITLKPGHLTGLGLGAHQFTAEYKLGMSQPITLTVTAAQGGPTSPPPSPTGPGGAVQATPPPAALPYTGASPWTGTLTLWAIALLMAGTALLAHAHRRQHPTRKHIARH
jgi:hypothetical protein